MQSIVPATITNNHGSQRMQKPHIEEQNLKPKTIPPHDPPRIKSNSLTSSNDISSAGSQKVDIQI